MYLFLVSILLWQDVLLFSEEVDEMVKSLRLKLFRTSVKENFNVDQGKLDNNSKYYVPC